ALSKLGYEASGFDLWPDRFQDAVELYRLDVRQGNAETDPLPYPSESFDAVIFTEVFEHLRINPIKTIGELRRVLRPGGFLLLSTPNLYSLNGLYSLLRYGRANACATDSLYQQFDAVNRVGIFGHIREYTWCEVSQFLVECGFGPVTPYFLGGATKFWPLRPLYRLIPSLKPAVQFIAVKSDTTVADTSID
ncbi:MAG: class I SAM-dependent methyltransferase, partial [Planctomycetes bacterium]|nr:class I SAM-dependent methyltransferase [Planctomycetota bacterium]